MSPYVESSNDTEKAKLPTMVDIKDKLLRQWESHGSLIIAVDFDDTIHNYSKNPKLDFMPLIDLLRECTKYSMKIVIYTARPKEDFPIVENFCKANELPIAGINVNLVSTGNKVGTSGKIYYNLLLDDKAGLQQAYYILRMIYAEIKKLLDGSK